MWKIEKIVSKGDYNYALVRDHPNATERGYVLHHRIVVENHLNRLLESHEIVHHKNDNKKDNRIENLEVMTAVSHGRLHAKEKGRKWCILKCPNCGIEFERPKNKTHLNKPHFYTCCSRKCSGTFSHRVKKYGETSEIKKAISENVVKEYRSHTHLDD
jgi:uncharacterized C2H2 Zn-finger protein